MNPSNPPLRPSDIMRAVKERPARIVAPTVICAVLALVYALFGSRSWEASQTLVLRNEAASGEEGIGRFRGLDDMKVSQETILAVANGQDVLRGALQDVGPADGTASEAFPTNHDIANLRGALRFTPPEGSEFGKTEIFYLKVKDRGQPRAVALCSAVAKRLVRGLQQLRDAKAQSMIDELDKAVALSQRDLQVATGRLGALEAKVGGDLAELRMMEITATGDSDIRRRLNQIETELRQAKVAQRSNEELLRLLQAAQNEPGALLATPNRLLESQPALRRLKEGLVDAQLQTAKLLGMMSEQHPLVIAARESEAEVRANLHRELAVAISGVNVDLRLTSDRVQTLGMQRSETIARLDKLAGLRAEYSTLVADVRHRTTLTEASRRNLAAARATQAGARSSSLISLIGTPTTGTSPLGMGRTMLALSGLIFGGLIGFGWVFLTAQPASSHHVANGRAAALQYDHPRMASGGHDNLWTQDNVGLNQSRNGGSRR